MIQMGDNAILRTKKAIYSPCEILSISSKAVTVRFCKEVEWDAQSQKMVSNWATETIDRSKMVSLVQML